MNKELCLSCDDGRLVVECCNGADGCSCNGGLVDMGVCNVCKGTGYINDNSDKNANIKHLSGRCFAGSGPTRGYWAYRR
jgi:hypothetical protein